MPIKSGIGVGEAQIFDTSGIIGTYGKILAQQQRSDERYAADLADLISKVDTEGVREPDLPEITKYYDAIKNTYRNALSTRNTSDRAMYRAEIANGLNKLNNFAKKSVEFKKEYKNLASEFQKNPWMLDSEKDARLRKMSALPLTQLGEDAVIDPLNWMPKPDNSLLNNLFSDVNSKLKNIAETRMPVSSKSKGGFTYATYGVKPEEADQLIASRLEVSPKAEYSIRNLYSEANPGVTNPSEQDLIKFARSLYESQHGGANAYIFGGGRTKDSVGSGKEESSEDIFAKYVIGLFGSQKNSYLEKIRNIAGRSDRKATIEQLPGNQYKITYRPALEVGSKGFGFLIENPAPIVKIAKNPEEVLGYLKDAGVSTSWAKLYEKVSQGSVPKSSNINKTTLPKTNVVKGKKDEKL